MQTQILHEPANASATLQTIYRRRAVRRYRNTPVPEPVLNDLLNAGRMAPSALNNQPWKFYVLTDRVSIQALSADIVSVAKAAMAAAPPAINAQQEALPSDFFEGADPVFHEAPVVVFITGPKESEWAALDIGMCSENIMLAAKAAGLDSCPIGFAKFVVHSPLFPQLGIPETQTVHLAIVLGYGDETPAVHARVTDNLRFVKPVIYGEAHGALKHL